MGDLLRLLLAIGVAYLAVLLAWPFVRTRRVWALWLARGIGVAILFSVLIIPADRVGLRAIAALHLIELTFKVFDYARQVKRLEPDQLRRGSFLRFLIPLPGLSAVFGHREREWSQDRWGVSSLLGFLVAGGVFASGFVLLWVVTQIPAARSSFLLDHALKFVIFILAIEALSRAVYRLERFLGFQTSPIVRSAYLSVSVAELWSRFNTRVHHWLWHNVYRPAGGERSPVKGVFLVFLVSAAFHELMFGLATSRFDGYQFMFFMLQAPAVLASRSIMSWTKRHGAIGAAASRVVTVAWFFVTSMLFFHGVDRVFPFFYVSEPWLP